MDDGVGAVRQQIGEILGTVRGLAEAVKEVKDDASRREDRLSSEIRTIKHESRQSEHTLLGQMELLKAQFRELDNKARIISDELAQVKKSVNELEGLKEP